MKELLIEVAEMSCASCSAKVEGIAQGTEGVERAKVNLLTESLTLTYDDRLDLPGLLAKREADPFFGQLGQTGSRGVSGQVARKTGQPHLWGGGDELRQLCRQG